MRIQLNGESKELPEGSTLEDLLVTLAMQPQRVAIELNRNVARRADWNTTVLHEDDRVEIVHFVGGGVCRRS